MLTTQAGLSSAIGTLDIDLNLVAWAAIAQIVLALSALGALIGAIVQIHAAKTASRVAITYNYTERFSETTRTHLTAAYDLFVLGGETAEERFTDFLEWDPPQQLDALVVSNLIEEIAGMYNNNLLHKPIAGDFFGVLAAEMWQLGSWFIGLYRSRADDTNFYRQWELMLIDIGRAEEAGIV
jgi:hypothetical protein